METLKETLARHAAERLVLLDKMEADFSSIGKKFDRAAAAKQLDEIEYGDGTPGCLDADSF